MSSRSLGHRAPLLWLVLPFIAGLAVGKVAGNTAVGWQLAAALLATATALIASWKWPRVWATAVAFAMVLAGSASYALQRARLPSWETLPPREVRVALRVDRVFVASDARKSTGLATIVRAQTPVRDLQGQRVYFSLGRRTGQPAPIRSEHVSIVGLLTVLPPNPPIDTFDGYLAGAGMNFRLTRGQILLTEQPPHGYYRFCAHAAERFHAILGIGIAEKRPALAGLLRAMMLGDTHELSDEQHALFMQSGTMHLFAISGLNIGVIAGSLQALLLAFRLPPWVRLVLGAILLWLFVDITGATPSAVRAFMMAVFLQAAFVLKRPANVLAALVASALVVMLIAPLQIFSASFLMSYTIVIALLVLGLPLAEAWLAHWTPWRWQPKATWRWWQQMIDWVGRTIAGGVAIGLATTLVSLLTGLQFFRLLTPGALAANLVLIPAAVIVTLGGFAALLCGGLGFTFGASLCNHAAALVLFVIEWLVRVSVRLPGAFVPAHFTSPWIGAAALALTVAALFAGYAAEWRWRRGGWVPPFAIVLLTLLLGVKFDH